MSLEQQFKESQVAVKTLPAQDNDVLLKFYGLYKQATDGDVSGKKPGMFDFVAKAKYEAWEGFKGLSKEAAMQEYVNLVNARLEAAKS